MTQQRPAGNPDVSDDSVVTLIPSMPKVINQAQLLDFIIMMNLVQQRGEPQDVTAGPATVSSPRTVVRISPSTPPARGRVPTGSGKPGKPGKIKFSGKVMESHGTLKNRQKSWKSHGT